MELLNVGEVGRRKPTRRAVWQEKWEKEKEKTLLDERYSKKSGKRRRRMKKSFVEIKLFQVKPVS